MKEDEIIKNDIRTIAVELKEEASKLSGKTLLITGGEGFIGSYIVKTILELNKNFLKKPCKVISIDNHITSVKDKNNKRDKEITKLKKDVKKPITLLQKVDYIIHAAGIASPVYYSQFPLETIEVAVNGTKHMLDLANRKRVKSILYFSSSEIYGDPPAHEIPTKEDYNGNVSCIGPRSCYDESKRLGETLCMTYFRKFDTPVKIVRPFNIFGPGMRKDDRRVIPTFVVSALQNEEFPVHTRGNQTRTFCYITDAIIGFIKVLLSDLNGEVYNVGNSDNEMKIAELAKLIKKLVGVKTNLDFIDYPQGYPQDEPKRRCPDTTKIKRHLNHKSSVKLEEGLLRVINWYRYTYNL